MALAERNPYWPIIPSKHTVHGLWAETFANTQISGEKIKLRENITYMCDTDRQDSATISYAKSGLSPHRDEAMFTEMSTA